MGHYYPWASPEAIGRLTLPQLGLYLRAIPDLEWRRHAGTARLAWLTQALKGGEHEESEFWPGFAQRAEDQKELAYTGQLARDLRTAARLHLLTQEGLEELGAEDVHQSLKALKGGD